MTTLTVNGRSVTIESDDDTPLLWVLRDELKLTGTKYGCGIAQCGACTVHVAGQAMRSCAVPVASVDGQEILTIEGLADGEQLHVVQEAWIAEQVPQCGYCQSGMLMSAAALLKVSPQPTDDEIDSFMTNICRCGTYPRIRRAIHRAAGVAKGADE